MLDAHPDIAMTRPARPEPRVFMSAELVARGLDWYRSTYFSHATSEKLLGEKSTSYIEAGDAAARAASMLGDAEIVVQLRDPLERAVSNWRFSSAHGLEQRPMAQALADNLEGPRDWDATMTSVSPFAYLERGRYVDYLEPWFASFPRTVHVRFLEDLVAGRSSAADLYTSLGVDLSFEPPDVGIPVNPSSGPTPEIDAPLRRRLRDYFRDSDARLGERLGRGVPWPSR